MLYRGFLFALALFLTQPAEATPISKSTATQKFRAFVVTTGKYCEILSEDILNTALDAAFSISPAGALKENESSCFQMIDSKIAGSRSYSEGARKFYLVFVPDYLILTPAHGVIEGIQGMARAKSVEEKTVQFWNMAVSGTALFFAGRGAIGLAGMGADGMAAVAEGVAARMTEPLPVPAFAGEVPANRPSIRLPNRFYSIADKDGNPIPIIRKTDSRLWETRHSCGHMQNYSDGAVELTNHSLVGDRKSGIRFIPPKGKEVLSATTDGTGNTLVKFTDGTCARYEGILGLLSKMK